MITRALIVITAAIAILFTVASHARAQDRYPISGTFTFSMERVSGRTCIASHYGHRDGYNGGRTANGEIFDTYRNMTAAMLKPQPFNSHVTVTNLSNGRSVTVRINDRGPFVKGRCIDLSYRASRAIGMGGTARVRVE